MILFLKQVFTKTEQDPSTYPECLDCGACCSYFKVYFKAKDNPEYLKLKDKINIINEDKIFMKGTEKFNSSKCIALEGEVGKCVSCSVYDDRPDVCRKFERILPNGKLNPRCIQARKAKGLN